mgnify:FL=1
MLFDNISPPFNTPSCTKTGEESILNEGHGEGQYEVELSAVASRKQPNGLVGSKSTVVNKLFVIGRKSSKNFEASHFIVVFASFHVDNESSRAFHTNHPHRVTIF